MWSYPQEMRFTHDGLVYISANTGCDYGDLRAAPVTYPHLQELPEMSETGIIVAPACPGISTSPSHLYHHHHHNSTISSSNGTVVQQDGTTFTATSTVLTVRMIMQGKEVGSIIGKKGDNIKKFREESGAKINISDGSCPERVVTVTGSSDNICRAFDFICKKFEEDLQNTPTTPKPPVTLRLVVPASQCGSLIGKQGCKIKEIRESTGASIQVASEMLPNSTERAVTVSGTAEAITQCIKYVCAIMLESPPKGANLPYRPKPLLSPVYISGNQGFTLPATLTALPGHELQQLPKGFTHPVQMAQAIPMIPSAQTMLPGSLVPVNGLGPSLQFAPRQVNPANQHSALTSQGQQAQEMNIPNDLIGCIIGRGGQKINEIRQVSGATIKISNAENGLSDRKVTISGSPECIGLAQYLISTSMKLHKTLTLDPASLSPVSSVAGPMPHLSPHPMAMTVVKPLPPPGMLGLNGMASLNGVTQLVHPTSLGAQVAPASVAIASLPAPTAIMGGKPLQTKMRLGLTATSAFKAAERPKFSPY